ncbi:MAG: DUF4394 domain-containing protein [Geminicoccaceae bacterium]
MSTATTQAELLAGDVFAARLKDINATGAEGSAFLVQTNGELHVSLTANGLDPNMVHVQHIHGRVDDNGNPLDSVPPTLANDTDGDGILELAEGVPTYGPILVSLSSPPGGAVTDFPTAPRGRIEFAENFDLNDPTTFNGDFTADQLLPLDLREIVVHGGTLETGDGVGTPGEADGTPGFKLVLPVATGPIDHGVKVFTAEISELNNSGVSGLVTALLDGDQLTVKVDANGLEPGMPHAQHIHGAFDADGTVIDSTTPVPAQDTDGDGFIEVLEGATSYGPVLVSLTDPIGSGLDGFPTAPNGDVDFQTVVDLSDPSVTADGFTPGDVLPLSLREFVIHGLSVDGTAGAGTEGEVDGTPGYKVPLPVGAGEFVFQGVISGDEAILPALVEGQTVAEEDRTPVDSSRIALSLGDVNHPGSPAIVANGYTNSVAGATTTTQFALDHVTNSLATLANNAGTLNTVGTVMMNGSVLDFSADAGLDIQTAGDGTNTAFALLNVAGQSGLYTIDLESAEATLVGTFDGALGTLNGLTVQNGTGFALADDGTTLVSFDLTDPGTTSTVALSGDGTRLDAIDVRPATGEIFGYDDVSDSYFTLDAASGALTSASGDVTLTSTGNLDIDWNPTIDRMRTVSEEDENIVYNPETGAASDAATTPLFYATPNASVTFNDEHAADNHALGAFTINEDGSIGAVRTVFDSLEHAQALTGLPGARPGGGARNQGDSVDLGDLFAPGDLPPGGKIGLFLIEDGADLNAADLLNSDTLGFLDTSTGKAATPDSDPGDISLVELTSGDELAGDVIHTLSQLNENGEVLAIGGLDPVSGATQIGFEDGTDFDFNDVEITFANGTGGDRVFSADEIDALLGDMAAA